MQERLHGSRSVAPIPRFVIIVGHVLVGLVLAANLMGVALAAKLNLAGTYEGRAPAADAAKRVFTLTLSPDGSVVFTTRYLGKNDVVEHGRWAREGKQVTLNLDPMGPNRPPAPIAFRYHGHSLLPLHWDPSEWGSNGPPVFHRSHANPGGV
jgi:hypothetical protein